MLPALRRLPLAVAVLLSALLGACGDTSGAVHINSAGTSVALTSAQLTELPTATLTYKDHRYTGVRLRDVLAHANIAADQNLTAVGADDYSKVLTPATLQRDDAILAYAVDDGLLRADEGPLRIVVADAPGLSVKRLVRLSVGGEAPAAAGTAAH